MTKLLLNKTITTLLMNYLSRFCEQSDVCTLLTCTHAQSNRSDIWTAVFWITSPQSPSPRLHVAHSTNRSLVWVMNYTRKSADKMLDLLDFARNRTWSARSHGGFRGVSSLILPSQHPISIKVHQGFCIHSAIVSWKSQAYKRCSHNANVLFKDNSFSYCSAFFCKKTFESFIYIKKF